MNFQYAQIMLLIPLLLFCLVAWKVKPMKLKVIILLILAILALFNPVRFKQHGGASLERFTVNEDTVPERVTADKQKFSDRQDLEMDKLKKESLEVRNEEIN